MDMDNLPRRSPRLATAPKRLNAPCKQTQLDKLFGELTLADHQAEHRSLFNTGLCYDPKFTEHFCVWDAEFPERPERVSQAWDWLEQKGLVERTLRIPVRSATLEELQLFHSNDYIYLMSKVELLDDVQLCELSKHFDSIFLNRKTFAAARLAVGTCIDLVQAVLSNKVTNGFALVRPPGHHAMESEACGYSIFNNVVITAKYLLAQAAVEKILIIDWDIHHGHGTQSAFYDDPRVLYISLHRYQWGQYWPHLRMSNYDYVGGLGALGRNVNIPLNEINLDDDDYAAAFLQIVMPISFEFKPDFVLVSAGFDAAAGDVKGEMNVSPECFAHMTYHLSSLASGKIALLYEGGYNLEILPRCVEQCVRVLLGEPPPVVPTVGPCSERMRTTILNVIQAHREYWNCFRYQLTDGQPTNLKWERYPLKVFNFTPGINLQAQSSLPLQPASSGTPLSTKNPFRSGIDPVHSSLVNVRQKPPCYPLICYDLSMMKHRSLSSHPHPEDPERIKRIVDELKPIFKSCLVKETVRCATEKELRYYHSQSYIDKIKSTSSMSPKELVSYQSCFNSIYLCRDTYNCALKAAGGLLDAVDDVINGANDVTSAFVVARPPGHHAETDEAFGFCIFSNVVLAAQHARKAHGLSRVMIVDWDVHHGNGTQAAFVDDPNVLYLSLHRYDYGAFFPVGYDSGPKDCGEGRGRGYTVNIPWNGHEVGDTEYMAAFQQIVMPIAYEFGPELMLVSAGFDAANGDPLGGYRISPACYGHMTHCLRGLAGGKIVLLLEGGYNLHSISVSARACVNALLNQPLPKLKLNSAMVATAVDTINNVLDTQVEFWKSLRFQVVYTDPDGVAKRNYSTRASIVEPVPPERYSLASIKDLIGQIKIWVGDRDVKFTENLAESKDINKPVPMDIVEIVIKKLDLPENYAISSQSPQSASSSRAQGANRSNMDVGDPISGFGVAASNRLIGVSDKNRFLANQNRVGLVYDRQMTRHRNMFDQNHIEIPERLTRIWDRLEELGLVDRCLRVAARRLDPINISYHSVAYHHQIAQTAGVRDMDALEDVSRRLEDVFICEDTYECALMSAGSAIDITARVMMGELQSGVALIRPPGHHACAERGVGFCVFNNVVLVANAALKGIGPGIAPLERILIVDFDVHHGQGVQYAFYDDPRVLYFSIHRYEEGRFWPNLMESNWDYVGIAKGGGFNVNVPLNNWGMGDAEYLAILNHILMPIAAEFRPQLTLVCAGFDAALGDPEGFMECTPSLYGYYIRGLMSVTQGAKVVAFLEGGYNLTSLENGAGVVVKTLLGDHLAPTVTPLGVISPNLVEVMCALALSLSGFWKSMKALSCLILQLNPLKCDLKEHPPAKGKYYGVPELPGPIYPTRNCYAPVLPKIVSFYRQEVLKIVASAKNFSAESPHRTCLAYDPTMLLHRDEMSKLAVERPERIREIWEHFSAKGIVDRCLVVGCKEVLLEDLRRVCSEALVAKVRAFSVSGYLDDPTEQWPSFFSPSTFKAAESAVGCTLSAVDAIMSGQCQNGFSLVRPPGHHATGSIPAGFCFFNNVAIAAKYAQAKHGVKRVLILDVDVHFGNGTSDIFLDDPSVLYISCHLYHAGGYYPALKSGGCDNIGTGAGRGYNVNFGWDESGKGDGDYVFALYQAILPIAIEFNPELLLISGGFDAMAGDPLGQLKLSSGLFGHFTKALSVLANGRLLWVLEGGYNIDNLKAGSLAVIETLLNLNSSSTATLDSPGDISSETVNCVCRVIASLSPYWRSLQGLFGPVNETLCQPIMDRKRVFEDDEQRRLVEDWERRGSTRGEETATIESSDDAAKRSKTTVISVNNSSTDGLVIGTTPSGKNPSAPSVARNTPAIANITVELAQPKMADGKISGATGATSAGAAKGSPGAPGSDNPKQSSIEAALSAEDMAEFLGISLEMAQGLMQAESGESSSSTAGDGGVKMFAVCPKSWCEHLAGGVVGQSGDAGKTGVDVKRPCEKCGNVGENWICLACYQVNCGRHVNQHALGHFNQSGHPVALSFADLSVWCYSCGHYVHNESTLEARKAAHWSKFGTDLI